MRSLAIRAFAVFAALLAGPVSLAGQTAQLTIAPKDPVVTAPTLCQQFTGTFVGRGGNSRTVPFLWSVTNTAAFTVDPTGKVCAQAAPASASSVTGVILKVSGRALRDSTSLTVMAAPSPVAVMAQPRPGDKILVQPRPGLILQEQPQSTASAPATIARQPLDGPVRYRAAGAAPGGVSASSYSPISAVLVWQPVSGAIGYTVARATSAGGHFDLVTTGPVSGNTYTDSGLAPVTTYYWTVSANYTLYGPGTSAAVSATTTAPKNPSDFKGSAGKVGEIVLSWSPRNDASFYVLSGDGIANTQVNGSTYTLSSLAGGPRNLNLLAYYTSAGQSYADAANPAQLRVAALPQNGTPWLSRHQVGSTAEADEYYTTIGAKSGKATLAQWKAANGFPSQGLAGDEVQVRYFNGQDLNLGRDTHCHDRTPSTGTTGGRLIACYQNNSGPPPGTAGFPDADKALDDMVQGKPPFATVAMDQDINGNVNFYAYNDAGNLVNAVVLDNEGAKPMPNACTACHGGYYDANSNTMSKASFLPFDVFGFKFANASGFTLADQQEGFRKENLMVKSTLPNANNPNNPIVTFIDGMYGGAVAQPGTHASDNWVPAGWASKPNVYDVFKRTCRTCHLASQGYDFMSYSDVINAKNIITNDVCNGKVMPHAEVPYRKFWTQTTVYLPGYWSDPSTFGITCP